MYMVSLLTTAALILFLHICEAGWGDWSQWTPCSKTCGMGVQTRIRQCSNTGSERCYFTNETEEVVCSLTDYCDAVNGGFGGWGAWSNCTRRCGGGARWRQRACDSPRPMYGGKMCKGDVEKVEKCDTHKCPPLYTGNNSVRCPEAFVVCGNGRDCVAYHHRCDGFYDCLDGTDESACVIGEPVVYLFQNSTGSAGHLSAQILSVTTGILSLLCSHLLH